MIKKIVFVLIIFLIMFPCVVKADEYTQLDEYDFKDIQNIVDSASDEIDIDFVEILKKVISGQSGNVLEEIMSNIKDGLFSEISNEKNLVAKIIALAIIAAFFANFTSVLKNELISETGFFVVYMVLLVILISGFKISSQIAETVIGSILDFMSALIPAYFLSVGVVNGVTATGFYSFTLMLITIINAVYLKFILPLINAYVLISLVNYISKEDYFSKMAAFIKSIVTQTGKIMLGIVMSINVIQSIILPSVDTVKNGSMRKLIGAIPGIGNSAQSITEVLLGSSILIKNGIGATAIIVIAIFCIIPIIKLFVITFFYKISAAIIQPVSDKRIIECVDCVASSTVMLFKSILTVIFLFVVTIAIICMSTNNL